jgi:UDP-glucose 4-epimerase
VNDVVRALVALPRQERAVGQVYNIGSTEEVSILELARRVKQLTESRSELRLVPYDQAYAKGFEDMRRRVPSVEKIYQLMGWRPTRNLNEILRSIQEHQRAAK